MWSPKAPRGALRPPAGAYGACGADFFFFFSRYHLGKIAVFPLEPNLRDLQSMSTEHGAVTLVEARLINQPWNRRTPC